MQDFATNTFSWTANKISASIVGYHKTYLALEAVQYRIDTSKIAFYSSSSSESQMPTTQRKGVN